MFLKIYFLSSHSIFFSGKLSCCESPMIALRCIYKGKMEGVMESVNFRIPAGTREEMSQKTEQKRQTKKKS